MAAQAKFQKLVVSLMQTVLEARPPLLEEQELRRLWAKDCHPDNARALSGFVDDLVRKHPQHPEVGTLRQHAEALDRYVSGSEASDGDTTTPKPEAVRLRPDNWDAGAVPADSAATSLAPTVKSLPRVRGKFQKLVVSLMQTVLEARPPLLEEQELGRLMDAEYCRYTAITSPTNSQVKVKWLKRRQKRKWHPTGPWGPAIKWSHDPRHLAVSTAVSLPLSRRERYVIREK